MNNLLLPLASSVDLSGQWGTVWAAFKAAIPGLPRLMGIIAVIMVVVAIITWLWGKRRSIRAGDNQIMIGAIVVASVLAAPDLLIPLLLTIIDGLINFGLTLLNKAK